MNKKQQLSIEKKKLLKKLKEVSGLTSYNSVEKKICEIFYSEKEEDFFESLANACEDVYDGDLDWNDIKYTKLFTESSKKAFMDDSLKKLIQQYQKRFTNIINAVSYPDVLKSFCNNENLKVNVGYSMMLGLGVFDSDIQIKLFNGDIIPIPSRKEYVNILRDSKEKVFSDKKLIKLLNNIGEKLTSLCGDDKVTKYIYENKKILWLLNRPKLLEIEIWISYLQNEDSYEKILELLNVKAWPFRD